MSERQFLEPEAKRRTADAIRAVEAQTCVEVVVAVRRAASLHVLSSVLFGVAAGIAGFAIMWLSPREYDVRTMPLDAALAGVLGAALVASVPSLRRALTPRGARRRAAERAAQQAFASLGIEKTRERTGVLVFVALFERTVVLLPDRGIPETLGRGALASLEELLSTAVERRDLAAFLSALAKLGPACGAVLPRRADDENELCDDVA